MKIHHIHITFVILEVRSIPNQKAYNIYSLLLDPFTLIG